MLAIVGGIALLALLAALARRENLDGRSAMRFAIASVLGMAPWVYVAVVKPRLAEDHGDQIPYLMGAIASVVLVAWSAPHMLVALFVSLTREPGRRWNREGRGA